MTVVIARCTPPTMPPILRFENNSLTTLPANVSYN